MGNTLSTLERMSSCLIRKLLSPSIPALMDMSSGPRLVSVSSGYLTAGVEYQAVVEYAPIEKTPYRAKMKVDARQGTIEEGELHRGASDDRSGFHLVHG